MIVHRVTFFPALGKDAELRAVLKAWTQHSREQRGFPIALLVQQFGGDGHVLVAEGRHESLASFDAWRAQNRADKAWGEFGRQAAGLVRQTNRSELYDVIVGFD